MYLFFALDVPRRMKIVLDLVKGYKEISSFLTKGYWKSKYQMYKLIVSDPKRVDGGSKNIIDELIECSLVRCDAKGYYLNLKLIKSSFRDTVYSELAKELGLGDIFA